uniref:CXXC-type domain-containing protein n=1 Tax=Terrapene triunguis TaxID=2587831 RepID=A0A674JUT6_9SAUR
MEKRGLPTSFASEPVLPAPYGSRQVHHFPGRGVCVGGYSHPNGEKFRSKIELTRFLGPSQDLTNFDFKNGVLREPPPKVPGGVCVCVCQNPRGRPDHGHGAENSAGSSATGANAGLFLSAQRRDFNREQRFFKVRPGLGWGWESGLQGAGSVSLVPSLWGAGEGPWLRRLKALPLLQRVGCGACQACQIPEDCGICTVCAVRAKNPELRIGRKCLLRRCLKIVKKVPAGAPPGLPSRPAVPLTPGLSPLPSRRNRKCGECEACLLKADCGRCDFCRDKPKFGGENLKRQKCRWRQCLRFAMVGALPARLVGSGCSGRAGARCRALSWKGLEGARPGWRGSGWRGSGWAWAGRALALAGVAPAGVVPAGLGRGGRLPRLAWPRLAWLRLGSGGAGACPGWSDSGSAQVGRGTGPTLALPVSRSLSLSFSLSLSPSLSPARRLPGSGSVSPSLSLPQKRLLPAVWSRGQAEEGAGALAPRKAWRRRIGRSRQPARIKQVGRRVKGSGQQRWARGSAPPQVTTSPCPAPLAARPPALPCPARPPRPRRSARGKDTRASLFLPPLRLSRSSFRPGYRSAWGEGSPGRLGSLPALGGEWGLVVRAGGLGDRTPGFSPWLAL